MDRRVRPLSAAEQQAYAEDGFVVVRGLIGADEARRLDTEVERLGRVGNPAAPEGWIFALHQQASSLCADFARDERVLCLVAGVVSPGIGLHSSKLVTKMPGSDEVCHWHQDESYYLESGEPGMRSAVRMSIWLPLQDVTTDNGCLWVVPGSHRDGVASHREVGDGHCRRKIIRSDYADEHAVPLLLDAGDVVLFSGFLWHHSRGNQTEQVRRALIVSYQEASIPRDAYGGVAPVLQPAVSAGSS